MMPTTKMFLFRLKRKVIQFYEEFCDHEGKGDNIDVGFGDKFNHQSGCTDAKSSIWLADCESFQLRNE